MLFEKYKIRSEIVDVIKLSLKIFFKREVHFKSLNLIRSKITVFRNRKLSTMAIEAGLTEIEMPDPKDVKNIPR
jgi:hypothetical protein